MQQKIIPKTTLCRSDIVSLFPKEIPNAQRKFIILPRPSIKFFLISQSQHTEDYKHIGKPRKYCLNHQYAINDTQLHNKNERHTPQRTICVVTTSSMEADRKSVV